MQDIGIRIFQIKWRWAGHLARRGDGRWNRFLIEWWPREGKRGMDRRITRWVDDITHLDRKPWVKLAMNRKEWLKRTDGL